MANQRLNIDIVARDKSKQALTGVQKSLGRLKNSVFNLRTAFLGLGAGLVVRNLVNTGKQLENLRVRLKFLLKDTNEGAKAFDNMTKFASKVPFSLEEIQAGAGILATVTDNADDLQEMLEITGNVAAVTGLDFRTAGEQIQRSFSAGIGAADLFREKGVRNMLGFKAGATVSIEETVAAFEKTFGKGGRFGKATDELANTFTGTLSMIGDKVFNFKKVLLEAGFFEELKNQFGDLDKFLQNNATDIDRIAKSVGKNLAQGMVNVVKIGKDLIPTIQKIGSGLKSIFDGFMALPEFAREVGIIGAFLFGKKGAAALAGVSLLINQIDKFITKTKEGLGIFDVNNIKSVQSQLDLVNQQIKDFSKIQNETVTIAGNKVTLTKEELGINNDLLKTLEEEKKKLEDQLKLLEETKNLRAGFLPIARDEYKVLVDSTKEKEKIVELTARELGLIRNQQQEFETLTDKIRNLNEKSLKNVESKFKNIKGTISEGINNGITTMSQGLAKAFVFGEKLSDTLRNMAQQVLANIISSLIEVVARKGVELAIEKLITREKQKQASLSGGGGGIGGSLLSFFGGFLGFAKGGAVSKGNPILVGENGPELFVPNQTGQITQSARGTGGGSGATVNFNINTVDASGFEDLLFRSRGTISALINQAVNEQGRGSVI